jgi:endonuclease YncB( thermonuclease family)
MNQVSKKFSIITLLIALSTILSYAEDITVYITKTGKKYHVSGCSSLSKSKIPISLSDAINAGFGPCGNCKPPISVDSTIKEKLIVEEEPKSIIDDTKYPYSINGSVVSITDGDTITILKENQEYKIRLNGIDSPESSQAFGQKAKDYISLLIFSKNVDVNIVGKDVYNRYLGDVYVEGLYVNSEIIKAGYAWHYKEYSKDTNLAFLEEQARKKKVGLWQDNNPTPPWEYRKK